MMKKITAIGEALIDFIPSKSGCRLMDVPSFSRECGGAPANAAAAAAKTGARSDIITMLGNDPFGDYIISVLSSSGVDTGNILRTDKANTALAFVSLTKDGDREFSFYRNPSADMLLSAEDISEKMLADTEILHFCSVALASDSAKEAHKKAIELVRKNGGIISFDPNIRLNLWNDAEKCRSTVREFIPYADIVKISDEELEFVSDCKDIKAASEWIFKSGAKLIIYSKGRNGAEIISPKFTVNANGIGVKAADTTGAGDSLIGSFLGYLAQSSCMEKGLDNITASECGRMLERAVAFSAYSVTKKGAIASYPDKAQLDEFMGKICMKEG